MSVYNQWLEIQIFYKYGMWAKQEWVLGSLTTHCTVKHILFVCDLAESLAKWHSVLPGTQISH